MGEPGGASRRVNHPRLHLLPDSLRSRFAPSHEFDCADFSDCADNREFFEKLIAFPTFRKLQFHFQISCAGKLANDASFARLIQSERFGVTLFQLDRFF
jgi:hypothetical protein